jgi:FkbM family methyltransferase
MSPSLQSISSRIASKIKSRARQAGVSVHRWPGNRFDAMDDALELLHRQGYVPRTVIDVGANVGQWSGIASQLFHDATFHMIEPQPRFAEQLQRRFTSARFHVHTIVATSPGATSARMTGVGSTGAWVMSGEKWQPDATFPATTLDMLLSDRVRANDRTLLKLDVEGHELELLQGATTILSKTEVLVSEVRFYDIESSGRPTFTDLAGYLDRQSFQLYDIAALASRRRDKRLRLGDVVFVHKHSPLASDTHWD